MSHRPITAEGWTRPATIEAGPAPMLQWLAIAALVVDPAYQRPIARAGRRNVTKIAAGFTWSKFAPVVVAPIEGGRYAIIDGQHRTTAALIAGFDQVPCMVVIADRKGQAEAFTAINGQVTPITPVALHRAKREAGDPQALAIDAVAAAAGVRILGSVKISDQMKAGETLAVGTLSKCLALYGRDHLITALQCVTQTGDGNPGCLHATVIRGFCLALEELPAWRESGSQLLEAIDDFDIVTAFDDSTGRQATGAHAGRFAQAVVRHLSARRIREAA